MTAGNRAKTTTIPEALDERLHGLLNGLVAQKGVHHALIAIERGDGSLRWSGAAGQAHPDGTPMREDTPYWIASVTKLYIAAVTMKLYEQERLNLRDPISAYLPQSLIGGIHRLDGVDHTENIRLRHLLGHLSGLPDYLEDHKEGAQSLLDQALESDRSWTLEEAMQIVRDELTPHFPPQPLEDKRRKVSYSDTNYQLLIAIIESVTGQPLHTVFDEMLYRPLGLGQTYHPGTPTAPDGESATIWAEEQPLTIPLALHAFRDLVSTAPDTLRFMRALVHGEVFDHPTTVEEMMGPWNAFPFTLNPATTSLTWPIEVGHGMMRFHMPRVFTPFRHIPEVVGHTGIAGSWLFYSPPADLSLSGTVSQFTASALPFRFVPKLVGVLSATRR